MIRTLGLVLALLGSLSSAVLAGSPASSGSSSSAPSGAAGGDLGGTYPNPSVLSINGNTVPAGAAADQLLVGTAPNTLGFKGVPNCALPNALQYSTSTHAWTCGTPPGTAGGAVVPYTSGLFYRFEGILPGSASAVFTSARYFCSPAPVRTSVQPAVVGTKINSAGPAGGNIKFAIYADTTSGSRAPLHGPGALLAATGNIPTDNATNATTPTAGQGSLTSALSGPLTPGAIYWRCAAADNTTVTVLSASPANTITLIGDSNLINATNGTASGLSGLQSSSAVTYSAAWPSDLSSTAWTATSVALPDFYFQAP